MIYFITDGTDKIKVGYTSECSMARLAQLQTGSSLRLRLVAEEMGGMSREKWLHKKFEGYRIRTHNSEWFRLEGKLLEYVQKISKYYVHVEDGTTTLYNKMSK